ILMPMINEACFTLMEGVATKEAIDTVMKLGMNHPMGPLQLADLIGLDTCLSIMNVLHEGLGDSKYRPCPLLRKLGAAGGRGTHPGRGLHEYGQKMPQTLTAAAGMSFDLPEDVQSVREMVRDFAESEIRPIAAKIDETHEFPAETTKKMAELGLLG